MCFLSVQILRAIKKCCLRSGCGETLFFRCCRRFSLPSSITDDPSVTFPSHCSGSGLSSPWWDTGGLRNQNNQEPMPWRQLRRNCLFQPPLSSQSAADWGRQSKEERNGRHFANVWGCSAFREDRLFMSHASFSLELAIWLLLILAPWHGSSWMFMHYRTNHSAVLTKQIITHFPCYKLIAQVVNSNVYLL